ncbi:MAG: sugar phosphate nucleotidyltransferase [Ignavibacteria bacterium]
MQAVILAAGVSRRLRPLTDYTPKCLLDISGRNLLQRTLDNLAVNGIIDILIVTGYRESMIKEYVKRNIRDLNVTFITNPDYQHNNNSYSLWLSRDFIRENFILLDSDILFDERIITKLIQSQYQNCLAIIANGELDEEQMKVVVNKNYKILQIGKEIEIDKAYGESIGIEKFSIDFSRALFEILDRKITKENNVNEFYETTFQEILERDDPRYSIYGIDVSEYQCIEIDTIEDYERANKLTINIIPSE